MAAAAVGAPTRLLHHPPPLSSSLSFYLKPVLISTAAINNTSFKHPQIRRPKIIPTSLPIIPSRLFCYSPTLPLSLPSTKAEIPEEEQPEIPEDEDEETEIEVDNLDVEENGQMGLESSSAIGIVEGGDDENGDIEIGKLDVKENARMNLDPSYVLKRNRVDPVDLPTLTVREKKELASYAHSLGKKLKSQLVGKSGVTANVAASFIENLESNELLKVKIHGTCPDDLDDAVKQLEEATGSVVVGQIGRTVILYRPSLTKLKAEEKKEQMRKIFMKRKQRYSKPASMESQKKGGRPRMFVRDSRGRPRV